MFSCKSEINTLIEKTDYVIQQIYEIDRLCYLKELCNRYMQIMLFNRFLKQIDYVIQQIYEIDRQIVLFNRLMKQIHVDYVILKIDL